MDTRAVPEPVRRICEAMSRRYIALCEQQGISLDRAYAALEIARYRNPGCSVSTMFTLAKQYLGVVG